MSSYCPKKIFGTENRQVHHEPLKAVANTPRELPLAAARSPPCQAGDCVEGSLQRTPDGRLELVGQVSVSTVKDAPEARGASAWCSVPCRVFSGCSSSVYEY